VPTADTTEEGGIRDAGGLHRDLGMKGDTCIVKDLFSGRESLIEVGIALVGLVLLVSAGVLVGSRLAGGSARRRRHADGPPPRGTVPPSRHKPTSAAAAR